MNRPHSLSRLATLALATILSACSIAPLPQAAPPTVEDKTTGPYSARVASILAELGLASARSLDPVALEESEVLRERANPTERTLVLSESFFVRGRAGSFNAPSPDVADFIRSAHYAYEEIFSGNCEAPSTECDFLRKAYQAATGALAHSVIATLKTTPHIDAGRYILDQEGDGDPLTTSEWEISEGAAPESGVAQGLGSALVGCRIPSKAEAEFIVRVCAPITAVLTFEDRTSAERTHAHFVLYDSVHTPTVPLHGREIPLVFDLPATWNALLSHPATTTPSFECLSDPDPDLPTAIFIVSPSPHADQWRAILSAITSDETLSSSYNFCEGKIPPNAGSNQLSLALAGAFSSPSSRLPVETILFSQGLPNDEVVRSLIDGTRKRSRRSPSPAPSLTIAGSMHIPTASLAADHTNGSQASLAERDIRRLLKRLLSEEGALLHTPRSRRQDDDMSLSPVL